MPEERRGITIALDGPSSSGKGTVARGVARALGYQYVDTGALYRAVALVARERGVDLADGGAVADVAGGLALHFAWDGDVLRLHADSRDVTGAIRTDAVGRDASTVSASPEVRRALLALQRRLGAGGGVVMDGRDIGTVVLPDADLKVFLDADLEERARRRHEELLRRGGTMSYRAVRDSLAARDRQDTEREVAPLRAADDAVTVDTTDLTIRQAIDAVLELARRRGA